VPVAVTFDDGYHDFYDISVPLGCRKRASRFGDFCRGRIWRLGTKHPQAHDQLYLPVGAKRRPISADGRAYFPSWGRRTHATRVL